MSDHVGDIRACEKVAAWRRGQRISIDMGRRTASSTRAAVSPPRQRRRDPGAERRAAEAEAAAPPSRVPHAPWRGR